LVVDSTPFGPALDITLCGSDSFLVPLGGPAVIEATAWVIELCKRTLERLPWAELKLRMAVDIVEQLAA